MALALAMASSWYHQLYPGRGGGWQPDPEHPVATGMPIKPLSFPIWVKLTRTRWKIARCWELMRLRIYSMRSFRITWGLFGSRAWLLTWEAGGCWRDSFRSSRSGSQMSGGGPSSSSSLPAVHGRPGLSPLHTVPHREGELSSSFSRGRGEGELSSSSFSRGRLSPSRPWCIWSSREGEPSSSWFAHGCRGCELSSSSCSRGPWGSVERGCLHQHKLGGTNVMLLRASWHYMRICLITRPRHEMCSIWEIWNVFGKLV